jgi:hypothetical protein
MGLPGSAKSRVDRVKSLAGFLLNPARFQLQVPSRPAGPYRILKLCIHARKHIYIY